MLNVTLWLLFAHLVGLLLYVGGHTVFTVLTLRAAREGDAATLLSAAAQAGPLIGPGAILTLLSGIGLVIDSPAWTFSMGWVIAGLVVIVSTGAAEGLYFNTQRRRLESMQTEQGTGSAERAALLRTLGRGSLGVTLLFYLVVALMVFKPF